MTDKISNNSLPPLTQNEGDTLALLERGGRILERPTGWVIHLKGRTYGTGGKKTLDDLTERGFLQGYKLTDAGREALERFNVENPGRWSR